MSRPSRRTGPPAGRRRPIERLDQLVLAVAGHAGDAEDLAGADLEVHAAGRPRGPRSSLTCRSSTLSTTPRRDALAAIDRQLDLAADHQLGQVLLVGLAGQALADDAPRRMTVIRSAISSTSYSLWLMKMMLWPSSREPAQDREDLLRLLRRQHGRRLVEHEDPGLAVERLEDLDALLPADRQRAHLRVGVDLEPEPLAELADPPVGLLPVEEDGVGHRLVAEHDVLGDREDGHEHEVLVDHADAAADGIGGARDPDLCPSSRISPSSGRASP